MWRIFDSDVAPGKTQSLPINVLTDAASLLHRAEVAGVTVPKEHWQKISAYAAQFFPKTGNAFVDVHAALAHAMAGNAEALSSIIANPAGPAADLVPDIATAYQEIASANWSSATHHLCRAMSDHARIGGSRAQRDLLEHSLLTCLLRQDRGAEAKRMLTMRRPILSGLVAA